MYLESIVLLYLDEVPIFQDAIIIKFVIIMYPESLQLRYSQIWCACLPFCLLWSCSPLILCRAKGINIDLGKQLHIWQCFSRYNHSFFIAGVYCCQQVERKHTRQDSVFSRSSWYWKNLDSSLYSSGSQQRVLQIQCGWYDRCSWN